MFTAKASAMSPYGLQSGTIFQNPRCVSVCKVFNSGTEEPRVETLLGQTASVDRAARGAPVWVGGCTLHCRDCVAEEVLVLWVLDCLVKQAAQTQCVSVFIGQRQKLASGKQSGRRAALFANLSWPARIVSCSHSKFAGKGNLVHRQHLEL